MTLVLISGDPELKTCTLKLPFYHFSCLLPSTVHFSPKVRHYAGDVTYDAAAAGGFLAKHKDALFPDLKVGGVLLSCG